MLLLGPYDSPFVRRVAVTLKLHGLAFEHGAVTTGADVVEVERFNPLGRVPALRLDDGEVLFDSAMILDHLDELAGPARALTPRSGPARRRVNRLVALATGASDKYVAAYYERTRRPPTHLWQPWLDRLESQARAGLAAFAAEVQGPWACGDRLTQADVSIVAAIEAMRFDMPHLAPPGVHPALDRLVDAASRIDAFASTMPAGS
jgi:glutathione S-transferase